MTSEEQVHMHNDMSKRFYMELAKTSRFGHHLSFQGVFI